MASREVIIFSMTFFGKAALVLAGLSLIALPAGLMFGMECHGTHDLGFPIALMALICGTIEYVRIRSKAHITVIGLPVIAVMFHVIGCG